MGSLLRATAGGEAGRRGILDRVDGGIDVLVVFLFDDRIGRDVRQHLLSLDQVSRRLAVRMILPEIIPVFVSDLCDGRQMGVRRHDDAGPAVAAHRIGQFGERYAGIAIEERDLDRVRVGLLAA